MIDLVKVVARDESESQKIGMLASRVIVKMTLASSKVRCCEVLPRCVDALREWSGERDETEPIATGWLNLFVESSRSGRDGMMPCSSCCARLADAASADGDPYLSLLSLFLEGGKSLMESIVGQNVEAGSVAPTLWFARLSHWEQALRGPGPGKPKSPRKPVGRTNLGQTLVMHLLETVLPLYASEPDVSRRGILTLLLVPLLRAMYRHPHRAHASYSRYFYGTPVTTPHQEAFHILYSDDLGVLEDFQSRGTTRRPEVLKTLWNHASDSLNQSQDESSLSGRANLIIHGVAGPTPAAPDSPRPKMTRVSQLTCLIREKPSLTNQLSRESQTRLYATSPKFAAYRRAEIVEGSPSRFRWPEHAAEKVERFAKSVAARYRDGYDVSVLRQLFAPGEGAGLPAWVQDGEVTFLWMLTALKSASDPFSWLKSDANDVEVWVSRTQVTHQQTEDEAQFLKMGTSFGAFARERACLFDSQGRPGPKAWSLVNFLERAVVSRRPACYAREGSVLGALTNTLYCALAAGPLELERLRAAVFLLLQSESWSSISDLQALERASRLPTFLLEVLLRDADPIPYSLFFYPISFEETSGEEPELGIEGKIPGAFLAGTFAGLEWDCFPSVTERQNYHLFSVLDAIRPIIDHQLGLMLRSDHDDYFLQGRRLAEAVERQKAADDKARTIEAVVPAVDGLSRLFREAQGYVFRIESAVDPDWSGLFTASMQQAVEEVFAGKRLEFSSEWAEANGQPFSFEASHESSADVEVQRKLLYRRLVYLARQVSRYESKSPLGNTDYPNIEVSAIKGSNGQHFALFRSNAFLRALFEALLTEPQNAQALNLLFKLLTTDAADAGRGIHVAQIAAALGMSVVAKNRSAPPKTRISLLGEQVSGASFSPTDSAGISELAKIVAVELDRQPRLKSSSQFAARAFGASMVQPFQFLRALRMLGGEALATDEDGKLQLLDWSIEYLTGNTPVLRSEAAPPLRRAADSAGGCISLSLRCKNRFSAATKLLLWDSQQNPGNEYHNLRFSFGELCRAVGGFPRFISVSDKEHCPEADPEDRFIVYEGANESWFRILLQPATQGVLRR